MAIHYSSRRAVLKTGAKAAYVTPLVLASLAMSPTAEAADISQDVRSANFDETGALAAIGKAVSADANLADPLNGVNAPSLADVTSAATAAATWQSDFDGLAAAIGLGQALAAPIVLPGYSFTSGWGDLTGFGDPTVLPDATITTVGDAKSYMDQILTLLQALFSNGNAGFPETVVLLAVAFGASSGLSTSDFNTFLNEFLFPLPGATSVSSLPADMYDLGGKLEAAMIEAYGFGDAP